MDISRDQAAVNNNREAELSCRDHYLPRRVTLHARFRNRDCFEERVYEVLNYDEPTRKIQTKIGCRKFALAVQSLPRDKSKFRQRTSCFYISHLNDRTVRTWNNLSNRTLYSLKKFLRRRSFYVMDDFTIQNVNTTLFSSFFSFLSFFFFSLG